MAPVKYIVDAECCRPRGIQCNWVVPDGVRHVTFEIWGGGGGGASGGAQDACNCNRAGGPVAACCYGKAGGTSSVIGLGLTNFCAEGGAGGSADFGLQCYGHCGCMWYQANNETNDQTSPVNNRTGISATAFGYDYMSNSLNGVSWIHTSDSSYLNEWIAGSGAGPYGGGGGWDFGGKYNCYSQSCDGLPFAIRPPEEWHGRIPGGGGVAFHWMNMCECWAGRSGKGAPGMVKITY